MKTKTFLLKFRDAIVPQISRLPKGVRLVIQDGYKTTKSIDKYAAFSKNGKIILIGAGKSIRQARKNALAEYNRLLIGHNLTWGNEAPLEGYMRIINQ